MKFSCALFVIAACGGGGSSGDDVGDDAPCAAGTPLVDQVAGDCKIAVCDGNGGIAQQPDDSDVADECASSCDSGEVVPDPVAAHTACATGVCDGTGACIGCVDGSDCTTGICNAGSVCVQPGCVTSHLLISEIRTSGTGGTNDDFIELYNPTSSVVSLTGFTIEARSDSGSSYTVRFTGGAQSIAASHYFLIVGSTYSGMVAADATLIAGITDNGSVVLKQNGAVVDAVCVYSGTDPFTGAAVPYTCEGTPFLRAAAANTDTSLQRKPGGATGNCLDRDDNNADWLATAPAEPQDLASAPILPQ